ncbi:hypothetical protein ABIB40_000305 [Pedobacter sp. UYP30]
MTPLGFFADKINLKPPLNYTFEFINNLFVGIFLITTLYCWRKKNPAPQKMRNGINLKTKINNPKTSSVMLNRQKNKPKV